MISHLPNQEIGSVLKLTALEVESNCLFYDRDVFVQEGTSVAIFTSVQIKGLQRKSHFYSFIGQTLVTAGRFQCFHCCFKDRGGEDFPECADLVL